MRRSAVLLFCVLAAGQLAAQEFPAPDFGVIVEFRDPPLAERNGDVRAAMTDYESTFKRFRRDVTAILGDGLAAKSAAAFEPLIGNEYRVVFNGVSLVVPRSAVPAIKQLSYVKKVYLDKRVAMCAGPTPDVVQVGADRVWSNFGSRGKGIVVAILDTGIEYTHTALGHGIGPGFKVIGGYDFVNKKSDPMDDNGHGTLSAGIVAADSDVRVGVAPDVSLLAYKVLDAQGLGKESDIIAGIERATDPNSDGDTRDHADVLNLSLGGVGGPDDAQSVAVDRATAAGAVVVASAGNNGSFHNILSPSAARTAISVGATEGTSDLLSTISAKGPTARTAAIKPDVLAPAGGVSTSLGNTYFNFGGTSMSAPIVAGVAALLKAAHRDWTPAQIKNAIINTAAAVSGEVMARGSGRVDAFRAASSSVLLDPGSLSLGLDPVTQATWSPTAMIHVTNRGSQSVTYNVAIANTNGVTATVPPSITVAAGATADLPVSFTVTNSAVSATTNSFSFGADLTLTNTGTPSDVLRVPWGAVKAARATVRYDKTFPDSVWTNRTSTTSPYQFRGISADENSSEVLLRPGTYDLMLVWEDFDPAFPQQFDLGKYSRLREAHIFYLDAQNLNGDTNVSLQSSQASHTITMDGRDENGQLLGQSGFNYVSTGRIIFPPAQQCTNGCLIVKSVALPPFGTHVWKFGDINGRVLMQESEFNEPRRAYYEIQDGVLEGIHADAKMTGGGTLLKHASLGFYQTPGSNRDLTITNSPIVVQGADNGLGNWSHTVTAPSDQFNVDFRMSPDIDTTYSMMVLFTARAQQINSYVTPYARLVNGQIVATTTIPLSFAPVGFLPATWNYSASSLLFGNSIKFPVQTFAGVDASLKPSIYTDFVGAAGEVRQKDRGTVTTTLFAADGSVKATSTNYPLQIDLSQRGAYKIQSVDSTHKSTVTMNIDSNRADFLGPTLTSMNLLDVNGLMATEIRDHTAASLTFSAADYSYPSSPAFPYVGPSIPNPSRTYQQIRSEATKAWYRYEPSTDWKPLTATQVSEDTTGGGITYRVDLSGITNVDPASVDMRFDIEDPAGNATSYVIAPAFQIVHVVPSGRRGGRR